MVPVILGLEVLDEVLAAGDRELVEALVVEALVVADVEDDVDDDVSDDDVPNVEVDLALLLPLLRLLSLLKLLSEPLPLPLLREEEPRVLEKVDSLELEPSEDPEEDDEEPLFPVSMPKADPPLLLLLVLVPPLEEEDDPAVQH